MKPLRHLVVALIVFFAFVLPGNGCGPFFAEAVFVQGTRPDVYASYVKGRLGVLQPAYRIRHLVIAYDWLNGHGLSPSEQQQAIALDLELNPPDNTPSPQADTRPGLTAWIAARHTSGVSGGSIVNAAAQLNQPGAGKSAAEAAKESFVTDHAVPGDDYQTFSNCLDDAFATAARTFEARRTAHPNDTAAIAEWVRGQDAVFTNCGDTGNTLPSSLAAGAPLWLRQDRAYQLAAARFYKTDYDGAIAQLHAILRDTSSPWHDPASLVIARALIRRATVGQITEAPRDLKPLQGAPYGQQRANAQQAYLDAVLQRRPARLAEAGNALRTLIADPSLQRFHADAAGLLDFVNLRVEPASQAQTLVTRLSAPDRPVAATGFRQALIDLHYLTAVSEAGDKAKLDTIAQAAPDDLLLWLKAMAASDRDPPPESNFSTYDEVTTRRARNALAVQTALANWRKTHATTWLIAALTAIQPSDPAIPELLRAATALPPASPAWTAATYHRLRLTGNAPATRAELDSLVPTLASDPSRSTINLFTILRQRTSPTLAAFLQDAGTLPAGSTSFDNDDPDPPGTQPNPNGLCGVNLSEAGTRLFDHDAATILNTRMPLAMLAEAAMSESLPRNLRFQIGQSAWTRAVLLNQPDIARRMSPLLITCYAAWKPLLDRYNAAATPVDRQATGLIALMRFASTEPIVREGEQRTEGFATYSEFRDNWWNESSPGGPPIGTDGRKSTTGTVRSTFFGTTPSTPDELPDPPFLTVADRAQVAPEIRTLRSVPCASDYFATAALAWQSAHPADPRTADILGFAERVIRNGCRTDATRELNHQLFSIVQAKYQKSEWAKKYTTWE